MLFRDRLWLTHRRKLDLDYCPLCLSPVKWVYDGSLWIPCDREPALAYLGHGDSQAVYRRELIDGVHLYRDGPLNGNRPVEVLIPHVFTCKELNKG
jgi:hypothetical protein